MARKILKATPSVIEKALNHKWVRDQLAAARRTLGKGKIGYNRTSQVWYPVQVKAKDLTKKETKFLQSQGLKEGWKRISDKIEAIKWLHLNFTSDKFKEFCCALLEHSNVKNTTVSPKRKVSGADGGIDGFGEFEINGERVRIAFEAKRHKLNSQVSSDICQKLAGAMMENNIRHGFIITTATFSERAKASTKKMEENNGYQIELIDQNRMVDIMLEKKDSAHDFGLHRTEIGFIYRNKEILRWAISKERSRSGEI